MFPDDDDRATWYKNVLQAGILNADKVTAMFDLPAGVITTSSPVTYQGLLDVAARFRRPDPVEPAKLSDCPHKPGTVEHRDWVRTNVLDRQSDPRTEANQTERARITGLVSDRREQMETDRARKAAELQALIDELPEPGVPIPPDPVNYFASIAPFDFTSLKLEDLDITRFATYRVDQFIKFDFTNITNT